MLRMNVYVVLIVLSVSSISTLLDARRTKNRSPAPSSAAEPASNATEEEGGSSDGSLHRSNKMEFDARLVKGQTAKSGAVYLFKRVPRKLPGLVAFRRSYRNRIVEPVLGVRELKPVKNRIKTAETEE